MMKQSEILFTGKKIQLSIATTILLSAVNTQAQDNFDLGTLTISSATKSEQSIKDITSDVSVITNTELEEKNVHTVTEALNLASGISFTSNGGIGSTTSINLRGSGNNRVLVLIDGIKYQDPSSTSGANITHLMNADIEKIEIIKGAQSGIWGADAAAGVINIITKKAKSGTHGSLEAELGSFQSKKYGATISHKTKEFDIKLSGHRFTNDGFTTQAPYGQDIDNYEDDSYENTVFNLQGNYYLTDSASLGFNYFKSDATKEYDTASPNDQTMKSDIDDDLYSINYTQQIDKHTFKVKYDKSEFEREEIGSTFGVKQFDGEIDTVELNDHYKYMENSFALFGVGYTKDDVTYTTVTNTTKTHSNTGKFVYLTNSNSFNNTIFTQSIRYDHYNNFDNKVTGKIGVKHNFTQDLFLSSNIGSAYNVPNIIQELNPWGAPNTNLNPEDSYSADVSLGYKDIKLTYFYQKVKDLINWYDPDGFMGPIVGYYENLDGKSTFEGIELEYSKGITETSFLSLGYTYLSAKDEDKEYLARRAQESLKFGLDYYGISKLHIGLNGEYIGKRYDQANKQGRQTGKYTIAHLNLNYDLTRDIKIYGKVENLTDKYYQSVDGFATSPRAFYAGIKYSF